jgi:hypothetical protein
MSESHTQTATNTYTVNDVETAFRRFRADLLMIADSSKAITRDEAERYADDAEYLARRHYLRKVDVTLLSYGVEKAAVSYSVNEQATELITSRPGGVLWPNVAGSRLRIILFYTSLYTDAIKVETRPKLKINWTPTSEDTSHANLKAIGARNYTSNSFGLQRNDFTT